MASSRLFQPHSQSLPPEAPGYCAAFPDSPPNTHPHRATDGAKQHALFDRFGRRIDYLRVSVTDRCDLRCSYCIPSGHRDFCKRERSLSPDEFGKLISLFAAKGVRRIRLTGGEPLTRPDILQIVERVRVIDTIDDISLSTNATRLHNLAHALRRAGVSRLNVSLDSLRRDVLTRITGHDCLPAILAGLETAAQAGFSLIKINMVVQAGINADELDDMLSYCAERGFILRLIEQMPVGQDKATPFVDLQTVRQALAEKHALVDAVIAGGGPARYMQSQNGRCKIGFITPMSQHFCASCNRLRLAADGALYPCLDAIGSLPLGDMLRRGDSDEALSNTIGDAVWNRPEQHSFTAVRVRSTRSMAVTGG